MKKFLSIIWILFCIAIIMRFAHWPGSALALIISVSLMLVHSVIFVFKNGRKNQTSSFYHFTIWAWTVYLLFRIQYWPYSAEVLGGAVVLSLTWIILTVVEVKQFRFPQIVLVVYIFLGCALFFVPAHQIYYLFNLNSVFYSESRDVNFNAWDKYSWFLYLDEQYDEALIANQNAEEAFTKTIRFLEEANYSTAEYEGRLATIQAHGEMIKSRSLNSYDTVK